MHGMKNPPHNVKVNVAKIEGAVYAELFGKPLKIGKEEKKKEEKAEEKKAETVDAVVTKETEKKEVKKKEAAEEKK